MEEDLSLFDDVNTGESVFEPGASDPLLEQNSSASPFLLSNLNLLLSAACGLLNLDAVEVYLRNKRSGEMERVFQYGKIEAIWEVSRIADRNSFLSRVFQKNDNPWSPAQPPFSRPLIQRCRHGMARQRLTDLIE